MHSTHINFNSSNFSANIVVEGWIKGHFFTSKNHKIVVGWDKLMNDYDTIC